MKETRMDQDMGRSKVPKVTFIFLDHQDTRDNARGRDSQLLSGTLEKRRQNQHFPDNLGR
jgi:hypothetical protein